MVESAVALNQISEPQLSQPESAIRETGRRALLAAFFGFFVDMFDVYLPIVALGPAMSYFQPATLSPALKSTLFYIVFALSLVGVARWEQRSLAITATSSAGEGSRLFPLVASRSLPCSLDSCGL